MMQTAHSPTVTLHVTYPHQRAGKQARRGGAGEVQRPTCQWCGRRLKGKHLITCSTSCRTSLSRKKHRTCVNAMHAAFGGPRSTWERLMKRYGLPEVEQRMNALGWHFYPRLKNWFYDDVANTAQERAA